MVLETTVAALTAQLDTAAGPALPTVSTVDEVVIKTASTSSLPPWLEIANARCAKQRSGVLGGRLTLHRGSPSWVLLTFSTATTTNLRSAL